MKRKLKKVILLVETSRAFGREFLTGIAKYSKMHGPWLFYREPRGLKSDIPHIAKWEADGIIMRHSPISGHLADLSLPTIMVLHYFNKMPNIPAVVTDGKSIAQLAVQHLMNRGFKYFAFCGFHGLGFSVEREKYFSELVKQKSFECFIYKQTSNKKFTTWKNEQHRMADWLEKLPKPIGIMACNDDRGQHVLEACKSADIKVPEDVAVIGVDNDSLICDLCEPPLSSIALNTVEAGFRAAELLNNLMNGEPMHGQEILVSPTHIVKRQSTDILAIDDKNVVLSLKYIRENAKEKLPVNDIVKQTSLSRRALENRFRKYLGRSIMSEVRRIRINLITSMLIETDMSINEISSIFNFTDPEHISRYFRTEKGMGLRQFRDTFKK